ncbi:FAD-binding domain-containing protein [Ruegeria arenilitoris]|uniref:FAD-binding domain-containing protein n=1 Tax=Ruegeria arenilitoris TaxID=1173585 RepID=UPI00147E27EC|nr:deoxyribodipyrimidine photo-lyase [Ruegeria arenilitoris]
MQIVWFKRDLRVQDNRALAQAAQRGALVPLYVVEPDLWRQPDISARQWAFIHETLVELRRQLAELGQPLIVRTGEMLSVLDDLAQSFDLTALWSHEETGNDWTFQRDKRVASWCRTQGIPWHQPRNHGVRRRLASRDGWAKEWDRFMSEPITPAPILRPIPMDPGGIPSSTELGLHPDPCPRRQSGGHTAASDRLTTFLSTRGRTYRSAMSSPQLGEHACSRLSPHLAWGTLSMREVMQATWARQKALSHTSDKQWRGAMSSFEGRLLWHCHFIQKLEDDPRIEFQNVHRAYDGIRPSAPDSHRLEAWANGETGLPFVDACMRYLRATGWLNFRMRAMVMATASYHLWLDWRAPGEVLARLFTDYEPGIHWSQVQMQAGTTGINALRIYNPVKQGHDQDPTGTFTRCWLPELADIPDRHLQEPWKAENAGAVLGKRYPMPIVDHVAAARFARDRIWAVRRGDGFRDEAAKVLARHGSRKGRLRKGNSRAVTRNPAQLSLDLGD